MDLLYLNRKMPVVVVWLMVLLADKQTYGQIVPGNQEGIRLDNADMPKQISLLDNNIGLKAAIQDGRGNVIGDMQHIGVDKNLNVNESRGSVNDIIINHGSVNAVEDGRNIGGFAIGTGAGFSSGGMQQGERSGSHIGIPHAGSGITDMQNKLQLEITELKGMQSRLLLHDASTSGNSANMQTLLNHIGNQIQLREAQQANSNNARHLSSGPATDLPAIFESPLSVRALIQSGHETQFLHTGDNGNAHPHVLYNSNPESLLPKQFVPHSIMQSPVMLKDQTITAQEQIKQSVFPQSSIQHILVPINSLSFDQILALDSKSHQRMQQSHGAFGELTPIQPKPELRPTTSAPVTTKKPKTTRRPTSPTTPRTPDPTTTVNMDKLEREYLHSSLQKQQLEISKLRLEIRALQRQETVNMPEMENDDAPPQRRGRFPHGMMPFPPFPFPR